MNTSTLYPPGPKNVPEGIAQASPSYRKHAWLAMFGLLGFVLFYIALTVCFGFITYAGIMTITEGNAGLAQFLITGSSLVLTVFMGKSLFTSRRMGEPDGIEITQDDQPELVAFLHTLSDDIGAPRPHRIFITPEVNAAVFYDLTLMNLFFPSKKNLIIGLGLVNVLNLGELKAVLAHEFGHFAQGSMVVGRWVYTTQQIIGHMVSTRDWLDKGLKFLSNFDLRVAWLGWLLSIVLWAIRSVMDTLLGLVVMAERALSREMEFNADLVAVSVTGSDALINALHKLQAADHAWQTSLSVAGNEAGSGKRIDDLFEAQRATIAQMRRVLSDHEYGDTPQRPEVERESHRVFSEESARPPQMWATHPGNRDRENNAKATYVEADIDERSAWELFANPEDLRTRISQNFYNPEKLPELEPVVPTEAVAKRFDKPSFSPRYRGTYLNRSAIRHFKTTDEILSCGETRDQATESLALLYPEDIVDELEACRSLEIEKDTLEALQSGALKPSGGVLRHRGEELRLSEIPEAIQVVVDDREKIAETLKSHDALCRRAHLQAAEQLGNGWHEYLMSLLKLLHCAEHVSAKVEDEQALLVNCWQVITADGRIGWGEKKRLLKVCKQVETQMQEVSQSIVDIKLPPALLEQLGVEEWKASCPTFDLTAEVTKQNCVEWAPVASQAISEVAYALQLLSSKALEELIRTEEIISNSLLDGTTPGQAPEAASAPEQYPVLMPGDENELQNKLDLWNRFQLAHGFFPTLARLVVSIGIVGGTIVGGVVGLLGLTS